MGAVVDTTVFIGIERSRSRDREALTGEVIGRRLARSLGADEEAAIASITGSRRRRGPLTVRIFMRPGRGAARSAGRSRRGAVLRRVPHVP